MSCSWHTLTWRLPFDKWTHVSFFYIVYHRQEGRRLVIDGAQLEQAGDYVCHASNQAGNISTHMTLYVTSKCFYYIIFNKNVL